ncbi:hypothetical protein GGF37_006665, partial [Kickxella alabastrina]
PSKRRICRAGVPLVSLQFLLPQLAARESARSSAPPVVGRITRRQAAPLPPPSPALSQAPTS